MTGSALAAMLAAAAVPFAALEAHRRAFTARLEALPPAVVAAAPAPGAWSLAQIADHFVRIDAAVRPEGRAGSAWERATSPLRAGAVRAVLALPTRLRVPAGAASVRPAPVPEASAVLAAWEALREGWADHLERADAAALGRFVVLHPIAGRFTWPDALRFLLAHHRHHDRQIDRTLAAVGRHGAE